MNAKKMRSKNWAISALLAILAIFVFGLAQPAKAAEQEPPQPTEGWATDLGLIVGNGAVNLFRQQ